MGSERGRVGSSVVCKDGLSGGDGMTWEGQAARRVDDDVLK